MAFLVIMSLPGELFTRSGLPGRPARACLALPTLSRSWSVMATGLASSEAPGVPGVGSVAVAVGGGPGGGAVEPEVPGVGSVPVVAEAKPGGGRGVAPEVPGVGSTPVEVAGGADGWEWPEGGEATYLDPGLPYLEV